jgi:hypothetical protein
MCLVWNCLVVGWYWNAIGNGDGVMWPALIITLPHGAVGLALIYLTLAAVLNRTVITVTSESITVRTGPLPWSGNRSLPSDELEHLYCDKVSDEEEGARSSSYSVKGLTKGGSEVELVTDLDTRSEALFIIQELERWLKIGGPSAGHEVRS